MRSRISIGVSLPGRNARAALIWSSGAPGKEEEEEEEEEDAVGWLFLGVEDRDARGDAE